MGEILNNDFFDQVIEIFKQAKNNLKVAVNMTMVYSYYEAGRIIVEEEQSGKARADYGKYVLKELSERLMSEFGRGFSVENLKLMRRFYQVYSKDQMGKWRLPNLKVCPR